MYIRCLIQTHWGLLKHSISGAKVMKSLAQSAIACFSRLMMPSPPNVFREAKYSPLPPLPRFPLPTLFDHMKSLTGCKKVFQFLCDTHRMEE